ncbi:MAG: ABC transporter permease [Bacteroidota bacterium]
MATLTDEEQAIEEKKASESLWKLAWKRLKKNTGAMIGLWIIGILVVVALLAPIIRPVDPTLQVLEYSVKPSFFKGSLLLKKNVSRPDEPLQIPIQSYSVVGDTVRYTDFTGAPMTIAKSELIGNSESDWHTTPTYILGTDQYGRDMLSRLMYGANISLRVAIVSQLIALAIGVVLGALAGFFRGWVDDVIMWFVNVVWSFPTILLAIALSVVLGKGLFPTFVAIGVSSWVDIARIVRGQFFSLREQEYVEATKALGYGTFRTIFRHMLPNAFGPIIILATAGFASAIIAEASLSFLGLGVQPPTPSWGQMINDGRGFIASGTNWGMTLYPSITIALAVFGFNLLGDGLRDALDPKSIQR